MRILFYDTETTGLPLFRDPSEDPRQPHLVQIAASVVDSATRRFVSAIDLTIRPDGYEIPDDVARIHGITTAIAADTGVSEKTALYLFHQLWRTVQLRVAHNQTFDERIVRIGLRRHLEMPHAQVAADVWKAGASACTATLASPIMKLPPTPKMVAVGRNHPKTPNLAEAYQHFTGRTLQNAHTARADVDACIEIYWAIQDGVTEAVAA